VLDSGGHGEEIMQAITQIRNINYSIMKAEEQRRADEAVNNHANQSPQITPNEEKPENEEVRRFKF
jgi:hypothetical protein